MLKDGRLGYDYLVLATGARHAYFGHEEWEPLAPGLKTLEDALEIRRRILLAFESAERETDADARRALLTIVVVGGGPTGVELAGAIAEIARQVMKSDFRAIDPRETRVVLVEAGPRVLATFPESLSARAAEALAKRGVEVRTGHARHRDRPGHAVVARQRAHRRATVLWAAGVAASPLVASLGVPLDRAGRVIVEPDLHACPGHPEVFVIGDAATADASERRSRCPASRPSPCSKAATSRATIADEPRRRPARAVRLPRQGQPRDHRPRRRRRPHRPREALGLHRLGAVARRAHLLPGRLPKPRRRAARLGLGLRDDVARRAPHHRRHRRRTRTPVRVAAAWTQPRAVSARGARRRFGRSSRSDTRERLSGAR